MTSRATPGPRSAILRRLRLSTRTPSSYLGGCLRVSGEWHGACALLTLTTVTRVVC